MSKGRKNSCPVSVTDWLIEIQDKSAVSETWTPIYGLKSMTFTTEGETEDGSTTTDLWEEPYISKRSGSMNLEGRPIIDESTGARDAGQAMLNSYADLGKCEADLTLRITDPYGHRFMADFVITNHELSSDEDGNDESWDMDMVGEPEALPFVAATSIALTPYGGSAGATTLSLSVGDSKQVAVAFTPTDTSNKRFRVRSSDRSVVTVTSVNSAAGEFYLKALKAGTSTVTVTSVNGGKTATLTVTVTNP